MSLLIKIIKRHQPGVKGGGEVSYSGAIDSTETITEKEFVQMYMKKIRMSEGQVETHGRASLQKTITKILHFNIQDVMFFVLLQSFFTHTLF